MTRDESDAEPASGYDRLAADDQPIEDWASPWADSPYQRHYVWPSLKPLVPDVADVRVLDAGCGVGHYAERFLDQGADVVGIDASATALETARERCGDRATFRHHDIEDPLAFADDDSFDLVFSCLVLDHVSDWRPVFEEFERVLAPGGAVVVATIHPFRRYLNRSEEFGSYHDVASYTVEWGTTDVEIESFYRPMSEVLTPVLNAGLTLTAFREATPTAAYADHQPDRYEYATTHPDTLCFRARAEK